MGGLQRIAIVSTGLTLIGTGTRYTYLLGRSRPSYGCGEGQGHGNRLSFSCRIGQRPKRRERCFSGTRLARCRLAICPPPHSSSHSSFGGRCMAEAKPPAVAPGENLRSGSPASANKPLRVRTTSVAMNEFRYRWRSGMRQPSSSNVAGNRHIGRVAETIATQIKGTHRCLRLLGCARPGQAQATGILRTEQQAG